MTGEADIVSGTAQGAVAGYQVGGVWGAIAGGAVGLIGGLFSRKGKKLKKKALNEQRMMNEREQAIERRDMVRQLRMARAQALAAGSSESGGGGSAVQGAVSSIGSQGIFNLKFFDTQISSQNFINKALKKADQYAERAAVINGLISVAGNASSLGGATGGGSKTNNAAFASGEYNAALGTDTPKNVGTSYNYTTIPALA